ncbi:spermidine/putrescine ABC transporter permease/substrate-binding protein [Mesoplasma photuris]|uniref:spermidine/putrescine ABC transporter permease/substrate-binding protein n=1 Tax=Mesoplasma photuris TaxID=217731 RepID=UPI0004E0E5B4|nr:spermidine/putrescine ABC transporter permease/substrate-binding protein [Mesoplasma photuris]
MKKFFKGSYFAIILALIYVPLMVMVLFSFNSGSTTVSWTGWSGEWYTEFFNNSPFIKSIITSLFVAVISTALSVVIGTMAAIGLSRSKKVTQRKWFGVANIPLINADVVTAVSLMIVFLMVGMKFGLVSLILAHVSFNVPYVLINVMPRLRKVDQSIIEAAYDLGAKNTQVIFKIILPILKPSIITATAIAFAMSFDDFIISYFTGGGQTNVSTFIYTAKKIKPYIFAFGTILVGVIALAVIIWNAFSIYKQTKIESAQKIKEGSYKAKTMARLNRELDSLYKDIQTKTKRQYALKLSLWLKYFLVKIKLRYAKSVNYDKRIAKLEWKQYKLRSEISKEKRYHSRLKKSDKKLILLNKQLASTNDVKKAAKISIQIEKLQEKIDFLNEEIEWMNDRDQLAAKKAKKIAGQIEDLQNELAAEVEPTKKTISWYNKKIKELEDWKIEVEEGKNHYKLRMVVEALKETRTKNLDMIDSLNDQYLSLQELVYPRVSITKSLDKKIQKAKTILEKQNLIIKRNNQIGKMNYVYEIKIRNKSEYIIKVENKVNEVREKLFPSNPEETTHMKGFVARTWKVFLVTIVGLGAFSGLTVAYVMNNIYDLVVANWGEYIDPSVISDFEKKYDVKINYQEYDSNETLYNKLVTFNYDVMVPSDYMVQKLASEGQLMRLDYSKLNLYFDGVNQDRKDEEEMQGKEVDQSLIDVMKESEISQNANEFLTEYEKEIKVPDGIKNDKGNNSILEYAIPYFWGDLTIVVNPTQSNIDYLNQKGLLVEDPETELLSLNNSELSWDIIWQAARDGKNMALNSDPKNIFSMAAQKNFQSVNLKTNEQVDAVLKDVEELVMRKNVALNGDEIITKAGQGLFDFAVMYNGDAAYANTIFRGEVEEESEEDSLSRAGLNDGLFLFGRPNLDGEGTNVFSDNLVISKNTSNLDLSYKFLNHIYDNALKLTEEVGIASPLVSAMEEMVAVDGTYENYANLYNPIVMDTEYYDKLKDKQLGFQYNGKTDEYLIDKYNSIIAGKN